MSSPAPQQGERQAMCDLMIELGPDAPTLCEGWTTYDLAAHVFVREHKPIASLGIVVPAAEGLHNGAITKAKAKYAFEELVDKVRNGPPLLWKPVDGLLNSQEYFVHHEDVRRGGGDNALRDRSKTADIEARLWKVLARSHKLATRQIKGVGVDLVNGTGETIHSGSGDDVVSIVGSPGEIVLYLVGRTAAAQVAIEGSDAAIAILEKTHLHI